MRVLAAMSGGVDSAVAAALAVDAGHDVTGVHMALSRNPGTLRTGSRGCCTVEDAFDARRVCDLLGIPYYVWDFSEDFLEDVVADFLSEYSAGRTPNPCLRCNEKIKFAALLDRAIALGFDAVATGHHVRLLDGVLHRSVDMAKDQSYVLAVLTPEQLQHSMFPLGELTKQQVRQEAARRGFAVAAKPDSYDICFIPDGDTHGYLVDKLGARTGAVVDAETGDVLGQHDGFFAPEQAPCVQPQSFEPGQLVVEFGTGPGIAIGGINRSHPHHALVALDHCFQITRMIVQHIVGGGQARRDVFHRPLGQDGDAVIAFLSVYGAIIAQALERLAGKTFVDGFDLLQT